jgi:hypothetical protein
MFQAVAFAGGGNRCYWQGGVWEALTARVALTPRFLVGVSGGGFAATYSVAGIGDRVRDLVIAGCSVHPANFQPGRLLRGRSPFPVGDLYRDLLVEVIDRQALDRLRAGPEVFLKISRPPRFVPAPLAAAGGIAGYQIEKSLTNRMHPLVGRRLGFRPDYVSTYQVATPGELVAALMATSSVPPFMPIGRVGAGRALDGGLVDNVPVEKLKAVEAEGGRTLVLVTRRYRNVPVVPGRTYLQPSADIPVGKFDITNAQGIRRAYEIGLADGEAFAATLR